jgi:hypothetical protein
MYRDDGVSLGAALMQFKRAIAAIIIGALWLGVIPPQAYTRRIIT